MFTMVRKSNRLASSTEYMNSTGIQHETGTKRNNSKRRRSVCGWFFAAPLNGTYFGHPATKETKVHCDQLATANVTKLC